MRTLIQGGRIIDPANSVDREADLLLEDGVIAAVGSGLGHADIQIDAGRKVVCPGFIDVHMHEDPVVDGHLDAYRATSIFPCMLRMGVTTAIAGNCGENKAHPADYLDIVDRDGAPVNVAMLAGHEYFRNMSGCTDRYMTATTQQRKQMTAEIERSLLRGCLGVSYGIRYVPGMDSDELIEAGAGASRLGRIIAAHIRDDAVHVFDAAREFIEAGKRLHVPMEVSHIGSMAGFGQMAEFLKLIDSYRAQGLKIGCDCYPYAAFSTSIGATTYDDGWLERYDCDYSAVEFAEGKYRGQRATKETFAEIRRTFPECMTVCFVMREEEIDLAFRHPCVMVGSDGVLSLGQGHPRAAGAFPRALHRYGKGERLPEMIRQMTALPAAQFSLERKGSLGVGMDADVVVFDPARICDRADFKNPLLSPVGVDTVIVGGTVAVHHETVSHLHAGKSVRAVNR